MVGKRRLNKSTFGVVIETGLGLVIPAGQVIDIPTASVEGHRTVDVLWGRKKVMMFVSDLGDRSQEIKP